MRVVETGYVIPEPSTAFLSEVQIEVIGASLSLKMDYDRNGLPFRSGLKFKGVRAYRFRSDIHCTADIISFFDILVEVKDSEWLAELINVMPEDLKSSADNARHYAIYVDSTGCYEIIASSWTVIEEEQGTWQ